MLGENVIPCYHTNLSKTRKQKRETYIFACTIAVESEKQILGSGIKLVSLWRRR